MGTGRWVPWRVSMLAVAVIPWAPLSVGGQAPPSALVNQGSEETVEAARAASPRTSEETFAYFEDEVDAVLADAIRRVWDPTQPRGSSPVPGGAIRTCGDTGRTLPIRPWNDPTNSVRGGCTRYPKRSRRSRHTSPGMHRSIRQPCIMIGRSSGWTPGRARSDPTAVRR